MRKFALFLMAALATLALPAWAFAGQMTLHPSGFGEHTYAAWKAMEGQPDTRGNKDEALYFQKMTETTVFAAAFALFKGEEGRDVTDLTSAQSGLEWQHRDDGWCGAGAPRWNLAIQGASGFRYTIFLGCAAAAHSAGDEPDWIRDIYPGPAIEAQISAQAPGQCPPPPDAPDCGAADALGGTIRGLAIAFDEGTTLFGLPLGQGFVYLDNIVVDFGATAHMWTSATDNGNQDQTASVDLTAEFLSLFALPL